MISQSVTYDALTEGAAVVGRTDTGRVQVTGADRRSYLHGLLTNDIEALSAGTGCYAAYLTAQGRMITDARVLELGDRILLDLPAAVAADVAARLARFVFTEDVQVEDVSGTLLEVGLYGPHAARILLETLADGLDAAASEATLPAHEYGNRVLRWRDSEIVVVSSREAGVAGFDVIGPSAAIAAIGQAALDRGAVGADLETFEVARIEAGRPRFGVDMDTETIPLEAGLEDRAISRTKGCYVGQEVIIRVIDRGHGRVARRLVGLELDAGATVPSRGDAIRAEGRELGRVTSAVSSPARARPIALGYVHRDFVEPGMKVEISHDGRDCPAVVVSLPFVPRP